MMNQFQFMGRSTADPETRYSQNDSTKMIARFTLAVNRSYTKGEGSVKTDFFNIVAFGKVAEIVEKHVKKGQKIVVCGSVINNNYTDKNGNKRYNTDFIANKIYFCEKKTPEEGEPPIDTVDDVPFIDIPDYDEAELPFE